MKSPLLGFLVIAIVCLILAVSINPAWGKASLKPTPTQLNPHYGLIIFSSRRDGESNIFTIQPDGNNLQQVTDGFRNYSPSWSPNRNYIAYTSDRNGEEEIYVLDLDTNQELPLVSGSSPTWSPDGTQIAFVSSVTGVREVYIIHVNGDNLTRITYNSPNWSVAPKWSPDGSQILFHIVYPNSTKPMQIATIGVDGQNQSILIDGSSPSWSPDGTQIAFVAKVKEHNEIFVMDTETLSSYQVTFDAPSDATWPSWSSDGEYIAYISYIYNFCCSKIFTININGGSPRQITFGEYNDEFPHWN